MAIDTQMTVTPQVKKLETSANYGKFDIEPLDPGFGTTLGNTLRRVLLSSLWGAAVTSIQIDGVAHEFTAIPHVKEDVTEVILNLKKRNISSSVHFIPLHVHPYYQATYGYQPEDLPVAVREYGREISLPIYSKMTDLDVQSVVDAVTDILRECRTKSSYAFARR